MNALKYSGETKGKVYDPLLVDNSPTDEYVKKMEFLGLPVIKEIYQEPVQHPSPKSARWSALR